MSSRFELTISVLALALLMIAATAAEETGKYSVNLATNDTLGTYLVNSTGFTLYYFANDASGNGVSNCIGTCSEIWLPFYAEKLTVANGLNAKDFTSQYRADDKMQTSYKGWPLYLYSKDSEPNDVYGQGINNLWFVVNPNASMFKQPSNQQPSYPQSGYSSSGGY